MSPQRLYKAFRDDLKDRLAAIHTLLRRHHPRSAKEIHDLRVAVRRARLLARLGRRSLGKAKAKTFCDYARTLLDVLSPIRDCDVALHWLDNERAASAIITRLRLRRDRLWHARKNKIYSFKAKLIIQPHSPHHARRLQRRWEKYLAEAVQESQKLINGERRLTAAQMHSLRRIIRRWRYLHELPLNPRSQRHDRNLRRLLKVQDHLGALQNIEAIFGQLKALGRIKELKPLRARLKNLYRHRRLESLKSINTLPSSP